MRRRGIVIYVYMFSLSKSRKEDIQHREIYTYITKPSTRHSSSFQFFSYLARRLFDSDVPNRKQPTQFLVHLKNIPLPRVQAFGISIAAQSYTNLSNRPGLSFWAWRRPPSNAATQAHSHNPLRTGDPPRPDRALKGHRIRLSPDEDRDPHGPAA